MVQAGETLGDVYTQAMKGFQGRAIYQVKQHDTWKSIDADELHQSIGALIAMWPQLGVQPGDKVAIFAETRYEWVLVDWSLVLTGIINVPIYSTVNVNTLSHIVPHSEAKVLVVSNAEALAKALEFRDETNWPGIIITMDNVASRPDYVLSLSDLIEKGKSLPMPQFPSPNLTPDTLASIIYTSGTTGLPKGVMITHGNLVFQVRILTEIVHFTSDDVYLSYLPISHVLERMVHFAVFSKSPLICFAEALEKMADNLKEVRPTILIAVPRVIEKVYGKIVDKVNAGSSLKKSLFNWGISKGKQAKQTGKGGLGLTIANALVFKKIKAGLGGRLRILISGSAKLNPVMAEFFEAIGLPILEGYGLTETSPVIAVNTPGKVKVGTVGKPIPGVEVKLAADGEILTKGPHTCRGYYKDDKETSELFSPDGFLKTGDIGVFDDDGYLSITDRKKELIKTQGGKYIAPAKLEGLLKLHGCVSEALIIGENRPFCVALIFPDYDYLRARYQLSGNDELVDAAEKEGLFQKAIDESNVILDKHETLKGYAIANQVLRPGTDELTPSYKLKRKSIMAKYESVIEDLYEYLKSKYKKSE